LTWRISHPLASDCLDIVKTYRSLQSIITTTMQMPGRRAHLLSPELRRRLQESDSRWRTKSSLRLVSALFCLIGFSLFAAAITPWDQNFFHADGPNQGDWQDGLPIAAVRRSSSFPYCKPSSCHVHVLMPHSSSLPSSSTWAFVSTPSGAQSPSTPSYTWLSTS